MKKIYKLLAIIIAGFSGGFLAPIFCNAFAKTPISNPSDALAIANTYIVFTTIIFVGFTVVLGLASYVFTQQFSASKENQEQQLISDIRNKIKSEEDIAISLLNHLLDNTDAKRHMQNLIEIKVDARINERMSEEIASAEEEKHVAASRHEQLQSLAAGLKNSGKSKE